MSLLSWCSWQFNGVTFEAKCQKSSDVGQKGRILKFPNIFVICKQSRHCRDVQVITFSIDKLELWLLKIWQLCKILTFEKLREDLKLLISSINAGEQQHHKDKLLPYLSSNIHSYKHSPLISDKWTLEITACKWNLARIILFHISTFSFWKIPRYKIWYQTKIWPSASSVSKDFWSSISPNFLQVSSTIFKNENIECDIISITNEINFFIFSMRSQDLLQGIRKKCKCDNC